MSDNLFNERCFRALTVIENFNRKCLANHGGKSQKGEDVVGVMEELRVQGKYLPVRIQTDNGSEFISKNLDKWVSQRTSPAPENPFIESFHGSLRDECLNIYSFLPLEDA